MQANDRALASGCRIKDLFTPRARSSRRNVDHETVPQTSTERLEASLDEDVNQALLSTEKKRSVLYLAYGSNLAAETFKGVRGVKPISQINVQVPSLRLTFDLPGIAYAEPCFANTALRDPDNDPSPTAPSDGDNEKGEVLPIARNEDYHKRRWHKGLVGVVYEVTAEDYAHIITTEGGGSSYQDVLVNCHPFESDDPAVPLPQNPSRPPFKAHTLFAPAKPPGEKPPEGGRFQRPDTDYAQPSARYLKLLTDGASEHELPYEYQDYLHQIRPYTITTNKQLLGQFIFLALWSPFITMIFALGRRFNDKKGRSPPWLKQLSSAIFSGCWASYDGLFEPLFGDGERTIADGGKGSEGGDDEEKEGASYPNPCLIDEDGISRLEKGISDDEH
ncbi:hypothetical protein MBLNU230_g6142t1 [Neophaeotheca triangularis]